jgi:hypothetical protein
MPRLDHDQQRLKDLGERLFGAEFHGKLARLSLVSRSYISHRPRRSSGHASRRERHHCRHPTRDQEAARSTERL